ncbi:MAG: UDP-N-acetylmuramoyl-L-alanyl-D-glutamate--2,6-diaminopimelate ligase [Neomegalonema sp.]|nr:UDP-N-acetylmuramoyl-L-alanyl-D-glutamate--2,6-diaminopimelate ligase [Neomegalonema sp.]
MVRKARDLDMDDVLVLGPPLDLETEFGGVVVDSRKARPGMIFAALKGTQTNGAQYIPAAIKAGASAVLCDLEGALIAREALGEWPVPFIIDTNPRALLPLLASAFEPDQPEIVVAVTGTNGKTSVADFTRQIWSIMGLAAASFGTTGIRAPGIDEPLSHTTPEPILLHQILARVADAGATHAAMEASSHGLAQHRLDGVALAAGAFTNLTRDHLDYHRSSADYLAAKLRLFSELLPEEDGVAVVNADDPVFPIIDEIARRRELAVLPFGEAADKRGLKLLSQTPHPSGQTIEIGWEGASHEIELGLIGRFQAMNVLAAAGLAIGVDAEHAHVFKALPALRGVPGRMELVARRGNGAGIFVDYAHTPDAITSALTALRPHTPGRIVIVLGAGGDRDPGKRSQMGKAGELVADIVVVTDDNPRSEDPALIRKAVMLGCPDAVEIGDREAAIRFGIEHLNEGDALLIAGKGHETGQTIGSETLPFHDGDVARTLIREIDGDAAVIVE